jgi:hypothetical protein
MRLRHAEIGVSVYVRLFSLNRDPWAFLHPLTGSAASLLLIVASLWRHSKHARDLLRPA